MPEVAILRAVSVATCDADIKQFDLRPNIRGRGREGSLKQEADV